MFPASYSNATYHPPSYFPGAVAAVDYPDPDDVRLGVIYKSGELTGTVRVPPVEKVELGYLYDANDSLTGTLDPGGTVPAVTDVRLGVPVGAGTGTLVVPPETDVRLGVNYDVAPNAKVGNLSLPAEIQVSSMVGYGANGTEFTGNVTLPVTMAVQLGYEYGANGNAAVGELITPQATDVREGVAVGNPLTLGTLVVPAEADVRLGTAYDVAPNAKTGNVTLPQESDVRAGVTYDSLLSRTGTLDVTGDPAVFPVVGDVRAGVQFGTVSNPTQYTGVLVVPSESVVLVGVGFGANGTEFVGSLETGTSYKAF